MWINSWVYPDELLVLICVDDVLITTVNVLYIYMIHIYILHWFSSYPFRTINPVKCITKKINSPLIAEVSRVCGSLDWWSWRVKGACRRAVSSWVVVVSLSEIGNHLELPQGSVYNHIGGHRYLFIYLYSLFGRIGGLFWNHPEVCRQWKGIKKKQCHNLT